MKRAHLFALLLLAVTACGGGDNTTSPPPVVVLTGEVTDAEGDAARDARVARSPDLVGGSITVNGAIMKFTARFAPGSLEQSTTVVVFMLDTDQNVATGVAGVNALGDDVAIIGIDYVLIVDYTRPNSGALFRCPGRTWDCVVLTRPVGAINGDTMEATVAQSFLGNDDGRLTFKISSFALVPEGATRVETGELDYAPNVGLPAGRVQ